MTAFLRRNRRVLLLKAAVAAALVAAHYYPQSGIGLVVNLFWLLLF